mgnify:CR=1 FL=1
MQTTIRHMTATEVDAEEHPPKRKRKIKYREHDLRKTEIEHLNQWVW